jgi:hypothetical protein
LNFTYRGAASADRDDLARLASAAGLELLRFEPRPCESWDAPGFHLRRLPQRSRPSLP